MLLSRASHPPRPALSTQRIVDSLRLACPQPYCHQVYQLGDREKHEKNEVSRRTPKPSSRKLTFLLAIRLKQCGGRLLRCACDVILPAVPLQQHQKTCPDVPIPCELGGTDCGRLKRGEMTEHVQKCSFNK